MNNDFNCKPVLVERGIKSFFNVTLKNCYDFKEKYYNILFNIIIFIIFMFVLFFTLYCKYKGKITKEEKQQIEEEKKNFILSKIKNYQTNKLKQQQHLITGLPYF
jgi:large-conductance mechanosensitive channel